MLSSTKFDARGYSICFTLSISIFIEKIPQRLKISLFSQYPQRNTMGVLLIARDNCKSVEKTNTCIELSAWCFGLRKMRVLLKGSFWLTWIIQEAWWKSDWFVVKITSLLCFIRYFTLNLSIHCSISTIFQFITLFCGFLPFSSISLPELSKISSSIR